MKQIKKSVAVVAALLLMSSNLNATLIPPAEVDCGDLAADVYATAMTTGYSQEDSVEMADAVFLTCSILKLVSSKL